MTLCKINANQWLFAHGTMIVKYIHETILNVTLIVRDKLTPIHKRIMQASPTFMHWLLEQYHSPIKRSSPYVTYNKIDDDMTSNIIPRLHNTSLGMYCSNHNHHIMSYLHRYLTSTGIYQGRPWQVHRGPWHKASNSKEPQNLEEKKKTTLVSMNKICH